jgi:hypothetical protein
VSEPMSDLDWWAATRYPSVDDDWRPSSSSTGRHAINEDAAETPIFHALSTGAWRTREPSAPPAQPPRGAQRRTVHEHPAADPVEAFRRDPLTMPIPTRMAGPSASTASTEAARRAAFGAHALRPDRPQPERTRRPERRQPEPRQPERRRPERSRQAERSWESERAVPRQPESRYPEYTPNPARREAVSDSGRHRRRRPSISSLL